MEITRNILHDFSAFFAGNEQNYGVHTYGEILPGKKEIGGGNRTVKNRLLQKGTYKEHLEGREGLGIVPITDESECKFAVIDIDVYDDGQQRRVKRVISAIHNNQFPIAVFSSKSGGFHLYIFFDEYVPAKKARELCNRFIRLLSIDKLCAKQNEAIEVFPKQDTLVRGQVGSWINLPYYNAKESPFQKMLSPDMSSAHPFGTPMDIEQALIAIKEDKVRSHAEYITFFENLAHTEAPPCLQSLYYLNDIAESRNSYLFSFGVYLFKQNEDTFQHELYKVNQRMPDPLPDDELENTVLKSIRTKSYGYKCKESPLVDFCSTVECKKREWGVGDGGYVSNLDFGPIKQVALDPPEYYWEINTKQVRFKDEDEILNQAKFRTICMRSLLVAPYKLKDGEWTKIINSALADITVEEATAGEMSPKGRLLSYFAEFVLDRPFAKERWQVKSAKVFHDAHKKVYLFRGQDFAEFTHINKGFKDYSEKDIRHILLHEIEAKEIKCRDRMRKQFRALAITERYMNGIDYKVEEDIEDIDFVAEELPADPAAMVATEEDDRSDKY